MSLTPPGGDIPKAVQNVGSGNSNRPSKTGKESKQNYRSKMTALLQKKIGYKDHRREGLILHPSERKGSLLKSNTPVGKYLKSVALNTGVTKKTHQLKQSEFADVRNRAKVFDTSKKMDADLEKFDFNYIETTKSLIRYSRLPKESSVPTNAPRGALENYEHETVQGTKEFHHNQPLFNKALDMAKADLVSMYDEESLYAEGYDEHGLEQREFTEGLAKKILDVNSDVFDLESDLDDRDIDINDFLNKFSRVLSDIKDIRRQVALNKQKTADFNSEVKPERLNSPGPA